ncbi:MAG TPA: mechanosensitive ion channel family protein [Solirubrobacteraceae bacterium]
MFPTRSHSWAEVGLARHLSRAAVKRARIETILLLPFAIGILLAYSHRRQLFPGLGTPVQVVTVVALLGVGWGLARAVGRVLGPSLFKRMDPATAGTVGFLIRLVTMVVALMVALRIAGLRPRELAVGGAFTAVVLGLAAQQTLGNLFAGTVLLSARPFRVGERVRLQGGGLAGRIEGVVSTLGLLYTVLSQGEEEVMVPNSVVLNVAIVPLREPDAIDLRARLRPGVTPADIQSLLEESVQTPVREPPRIVLEELDDEEVVVRIQATPVSEEDGPDLATEVLEAVARETRRTDGDAAGGNGGAARKRDDVSSDRDDEDEDEAARSGDPDASHRDDAAKLGAAAAAAVDAARDR